MLCKAADYITSENDKCYVQVVITNPRSTMVTMGVNLSAKLPVTTEATDGPSQLILLFPNALLLAPPDNDGWYFDLAFIARIVIYAMILGLAVIIVFFILKYLGACNNENDVEEVSTSTREIVTLPERAEQSETDPLMPEKKQVGLTYGTGEDDLEIGSSDGSSDELYDGKLCVICYDGLRNCFFVPCGHCATCYDCAQRIMEEENTACPICRRTIYKVRKLFTA